MAKKYTVTHEWFGLKFNRDDNCNQCGDCCVKFTCPHFSWDGDIGVCAVQDTKAEICNYCTTTPSSHWYQNINGEEQKVTHANCLKYPEHPWIRRLRDGTCSYKFILLNENNEEDKITLYPYR